MEQPRSMARNNSCIHAHATTVHIDRSGRHNEGPLLHNRPTYLNRVCRRRKVSLHMVGSGVPFGANAESRATGSTIPTTRYHIVPGFSTSVLRCLLRYWFANFAEKNRRRRLPAQRLDNKKVNT